jgi:hypothetical protein
MSRMFIAAVVLGLTGVVSAATPNRYQIDSYPPGYTTDGQGGYVYVSPSVGALPPVVPYYAPAYGVGTAYFGSGYLPPPVGFGSPYYSGYNDPNYGLYGPGVREFLRYGGADFYGW